jgi:hypothetical protein
MPGNSQKESALPTAENGPLQWLVNAVVRSLGSHRSTSVHFAPRITST